MAVFVLDRSGKPLMPCSEKRARLLLERGRARVHRRVPFAIRLTDRRVADCERQPLAVKLDPGAKTTGIAVVCTTGKAVAVLGLFELQHRGDAIRDALTSRSQKRRRRRGANLRYRAPRFDNRRRPDDWLAPSLQHRVDTVLTWVRRFQRWAPIDSLAVERVKFDMQLMQHPDIAGIEYQQGTLSGYSVREYLLEKFGRQCVYCDAQSVPLEIEHVVPRAAGGSNRPSNLTLACRPCNANKGSRPVEQFLNGQPDRLARLKRQLNAPLAAAAAVNVTRNALFAALVETGLPVETGTGAQTKFNRSKLGIPKTHAFDAACVGDVTSITHWHRPALAIKATGRGSYRRTRLTAYGFPRGYLIRAKQVHGFQTGDLVRAVVPTGKKAGVHIGRVAVRATGSFNIGTVQGISYRYCSLLQRGDGYSYSFQPKADATGERDAVHLPKASTAAQSTLYLPGLKAEVSRAN